MVSWLVLSLFALIASLVTSRLIRGLIPASLVAAAIAAAAFQFLGWYQLGHLDSLWIIAAVVTFAISFVVALVVGLVARRLFPRKEGGG